MKHINVILKAPFLKVNNTGCGECQTGCQSACKTSCTVGNQPCAKKPNGAVKIKELEK